jgi:hypothetical protein
MLLRRLPDTKHRCYQFAAPLGSLFLKVHRNPSGGIIECRAIRQLRKSLAASGGSQDLRLPHAYCGFTIGRSSGFISDWIEGRTAADHLFGGGEAPFSLSTRMLLATCRIHHAFKDRDPVTPQSDCEHRLSELLNVEGRHVFSPDDLQCLRSRLTVFCATLNNYARGFPTDYYKDSNPANWIVTSQHLLAAVDFESQRRLPFLVDLLNVTEYAGDYLTTPEKNRLLDIYMRARRRLDPAWGTAVAGYNIRLLLALFGVYRHQEQMLHRIRDLVAGQGRRAHPSWHKRALHYHLRAGRFHVLALHDLAAQKDLSRTLAAANDMLNIYEQAIDHFRVS